MVTKKLELEARMLGVKAALEGKKLDANTYDEKSDLHFMWLDSYAKMRLSMMNKPAKPVEEPLTECVSCGAEIRVNETHGCECGLTFCSECFCEDCG